LAFCTFDDDAPRNSHYEGPKNGCQSDEVAIRFPNVNGTVRAPSCGVFHSCPTDVPMGVTASPAGVLQDAFTHTRHCALSCSNDAECGTASCKNGQWALASALTATTRLLRALSFP